MLVAHELLSVLIAHVLITQALIIRNACIINEFYALVKLHEIQIDLLFIQRNTIYRGVQPMIAN